MSREALNFVVGSFAIYIAWELWMRWKPGWFTYPCGYCSHCTELFWREWPWSVFQKFCSLGCNLEEIKDHIRATDAILGEMEVCNCPGCCARRDDARWIELVGGPHDGTKIFVEDENNPPALIGLPSGDNCHTHWYEVIEENLAEYRGINNGSVQ